MQNNGTQISYANKELFYKELLQDFKGLRTGFWLSDLSNFSALVAQNLPDINWCGFYINHEGLLRVGPFQGLSACAEIPFNKGVCGHSFTQQKPIIVPDVRQFDGHIACDSRSLSELVYPISWEDTQWGVLDIDSPSLERFSPDDIQGLTPLIETLILSLKSAISVPRNKY